MARHPVLHSLHDLGLAAWAGGSLMGAIGLNGAAAALDDPRERSSVSTRGWSRWAPVNAGALAAHLVGAAGLLVTDLPRAGAQKGVAGASALKAGATAAGLGVGLWSAVLNRKMAAGTPQPVAGATEPGPGTSPEVARTQRQLKVVQWLNPAVAFALLAVTEYVEEQQRTTEQVKGRLARVGDLASTPAGSLGAVAALGLGAWALSRPSAVTTSYADAVPSDVVVVDLVETEVVVTPVDDGLHVVDTDVPSGQQR